MERSLLSSGFLSPLILVAHNRLDVVQVLYPHINNLLTALHALACVPPEPEPMSIKNHNELMRCFDIMGRRFPDDVITFLLGRLDIRISKTVKQRTATLLILK